jgi:hypothetical protein
MCSEMRMWSSTSPATAPWAADSQSALEGHVEELSQRKPAVRTDMSRRVLFLAITRVSRPACVF